MKPTMILVTGSPGSGKTTLAAALCERLGLPVFYRDRIMEVLWDSPGSGEKSPNQFGPASAEIIFHIAEQLMKSGCSFILESYWRYALANERLRALKERYAYEAVTLRLFAKPEVLFDRFWAREQTAQRHEGLKSTKNRTLEEFAAAIESAGCNRIDIGGPIVDIDTTDFSQVDLDQILKEMKCY